MWNVFEVWNKLKKWLCADIKNDKYPNSSLPSRQKYITQTDGVDDDNTVIIAKTYCRIGPFAEKKKQFKKVN